MIKDDQSLRWIPKRYLDMAGESTSLASSLGSWSLLSSLILKDFVSNNQPQELPSSISFPSVIVCHLHIKIMNPIKYISTQSGLSIWRKQDSAVFGDSVGKARANPLLQQRCYPLDDCRFDCCPVLVIPIR